MEKNTLIATTAVLIVFSAMLITLVPTGVDLLLQNSNTQANQKDTSSEPHFNIGEYARIVSSEKAPQAVTLFAGESEVSSKQGTELTIYNDNLALVKENRTIDLAKGLNKVEFKDVASGIDATSVMFTDTKYPSTFVVEQNYEYDIVSKNKLLEKFLEKEITVSVNKSDGGSEEYTGKLLSYSDGILLETLQGVVSLSSVQKISFPTLADGLLTKPTLVWQIYTDNAGERSTQTSYLTTGMTWNADYVAKLSENDDSLDLKGWVTVKNASGTTYPNSKLKLVAGDVNRVYDTPRYLDYNVMYEKSMAGAAYSPEQFEEESLFEYHMYSLGRNTDIKNNQTKQISLLSSSDVSADKEFVYDGSRFGTKVRTIINLKNSEEQGLGMPLPKGKVRVYKEDSQGQLQFVGEDLIDHTPKDEEIELFIGNAFDIVGERKQTDRTEISRSVVRFTFEITLKNHKETNVEVTVPEHLYGWKNWTITSKTDPYEKIDSNTIEFKVNVPADGEKKITYTVEYIDYY
ncbi:MAG: DUF4139 domain-containing protein [Candidatus Diapherotrites archaeon]|nr:DUF4139 domain-containing protein [Candidatus Diapherotrites archaeon]